jgi:hypothetical protein
VREGNFNILDIEAFLELSRESVAEGAVVFLEAPGAEEEIQGGVAKAGKDDEGTRFIETLHILLCDALQDAEDVPDVLMVANSDIEIESSDGVARDIDDLGLNEGFVGIRTERLSKVRRVSERRSMVSTVPLMPSISMTSPSSKGRSPMRKKPLMMLESEV